MTKPTKKNDKQVARAQKQQEEDKNKKQDAFDKNYQKHQKNKEVIWNENDMTQKATTAWMKIPEKDRKSLLNLILTKICSRKAITYTTCVTLYTSRSLSRRTRSIRSTNGWTCSKCHSKPTW
jgi:hypothetical protein